MFCYESWEMVGNRSEQTETDRNSGSAVQQDFTIALVLADAIPVLEFSDGSRQL